MSFKGRKHSNESNLKRSKTLKLLYKKGKKMGFGSKNGYKTPKGNPAWNKGKKMGPAWNKLPSKNIRCLYCGKRECVSINSKKRFCSHSCWTKYRFLDNNYFKNKVEQLHKGGQSRISKWAKKLGGYLQKNNINFKYEYKVGKFWGDIYLPDYNLIIECDGEYWHNYPYGTKKDYMKIEFYKNEGYNILNLWNNIIDKLTEDEFLYLIERQLNLNTLKLNKNNNITE